MKVQKLVLLVAGFAITGCGSADEPAASGAPGSSMSSSSAAGGSQGSGGGGGNAGTGGAGGSISGTGGAGGAGGSGGGSACKCPGARFVTGAIAHSFGPGQTFNQDIFPQPILVPPKGGGCCAGSTDVVSLGEGGTVTVEFEDNTIVDGPGPDFIVFENAFDIGSNPQMPYAELGTVEVSEDGIQWVGFPCTATQYPYDGCAGWHPVLANADSNSIDPTDPSVAGGDAFDLADISVTAARYVRITDRADLNTVFDLDAVSIVNALCP